MGTISAYVLILVFVALVFAEQEASEASESEEVEKAPPKAEQKECFNDEGVFNKVTYGHVVDKCGEEKNIRQAVKCAFKEIGILKGGIVDKRWLLEANEQYSFPSMVKLTRRKVKRCLKEVKGTIHEVDVLKLGHCLHRKLKMICKFKVPV